MIFDSAPWKAQLARDADELEVIAKRRASTKRSILLERHVFLGAYVVRKLAESHKISSGLLEDSISVKLLPTARSGFSATRVMDIENYFATSAPVSCQLPWRRLLNILVHSQVFIEVVGARQHCLGFLVASDHSLKQGLYEVGLDAFIQLLRRVSEDFPPAITLTTDEDGSVMVWTGHLPPSAS